MSPFYMMLILFAMVALLGFVYVIRWERQKFFSRGLASSWLKVRLSSIPAALIAAGIVVIPAGSTSGMEGLAVFYILLFSVAPLIWFGAHWAVGRLVRPQLSFADSVLIAGLPLIYVLALAAVAPTLQSLAWSLLRALGAK
ncbi:hypothetical protein [Pelobacter seleniigenes]|uniref:hypothetical protein n=1 Tax=Pelobacter seleniigenes TaxID=407188 RepID=UPI0004A6D4AD|nr:hypothetical protein [Pelobacter seleniigenes]